MRTSWKSSFKYVASGVLCCGWKAAVWKRDGQREQPDISSSNSICSVSGLSRIINVSYCLKSSSRMCRTSYYGKLIFFSKSYSHFEKIFLPTEEDLSNQNHFLNPKSRSRRLFTPCHRWLFPAMSNISWLPSGCWGSCLFLLALRHHFFRVQSTCSSCPRGVDSSVCFVTWASRAASRTWADAFPWDTVSEDTCSGSYSHPTTNVVLPLWLLWMWRYRGASEKSLWS